MGEKQRRKIEGDLKITQEVVGEMERAKKELDQAVLRKEREIGDLNSKLGEEQNAVSKLTRVIKETQGRVEEMEEELECLAKSFQEISVTETLGMVLNYSENKTLNWDG